MLHLLKHNSWENFEYLAAGRPILGIGPTDGEVSMILGNSE